MSTKAKHVEAQTETTRVTVASIRHDPNFAAGFEDYRAGRPPAFDTFDCFAYERGRQFAAMTPGTCRTSWRKSSKLANEIEFFGLFWSVA